MRTLISGAEQEIREKIALSVDLELFWAASNLLQAEEHILQSLPESPKEACAGLCELLGEIRRIRVALMKALGFSNPSGEVWCLTKHLISAAYRLMEASEKVALHYGDLERARDFAEKASRLKELVMVGVPLILERMGGRAPEASVEVEGGRAGDA
jgi:hypothetical protein